MHRRPVVIDIETVAPEWASLDEEMRMYLAERAQRQRIRDGFACSPDDAEEMAADRLALELGLAEVVAIGLYDIDQDAGFCILRTDESVIVEGADQVACRPTEQGALKTFWNGLAKLGPDPIVTFNGRDFDGPMLMVRSAVQGVPVGRDLVPYRYDLSQHCDLFDVLSFWGARRGGYGVDYWCRVFGIRSPKEDGASGKMVAELVREGRWAELGRYVMGDVRGEGALYRRLLPMMHVFKGGPALPQVQPVEWDRQGQLPLAGGA